MTTPVFVFVSGKGGVGKTTVSANMAQLVVEAGNSVLFLDLDVFNRGASNLLLADSRWDTSVAAEYFKFRDDPDKYRSAFSIDDVTKEVLSGDNRFLFVPSAPTGMNLTPLFADYNLSAMADFLSFFIDNAVMETNAKAVFIDCGPTPDPLAMAAVRVASEVVIVTQPDPVSFDGAKNLEFHIKANHPEYDPSNTYYVVNKVPPARFRASDLDAMFHMARVLCFIPYEERIAAVFGDVPFVRELGFTTFESKIVVALQKLARDQYPGIVPDEIKRLPPEVIDFYHDTLEVQKAFASRVFRSVGRGAVALGCLGLLGTILASLFGAKDDYHFLFMGKNSLQLVSILLVLLGFGLSMLAGALERVSAALLDLSKRQLAQSLLENKRTLGMLLKTMRRMR